MATEIVICLISNAATLIGVILTCVVSNSKTQWRIEQLEKKQDRHNNLIERTYAIEAEIKRHEERLDTIERHEEQRGRRA